MKHALALIAFVLLSPFHAYGLVTAEDLRPYKTERLQEKVVELRVKYAVMCPLGVVGGVVTAGLQVVPFLSTVNAIVGRSEDWRSTDWALQESLVGANTPEVYVSTAGGVLAPVYDVLAGTVSTTSNLVGGRFESGYRFGATKASFRILATQESRMIGSRSSCARTLAEIRVLKREIKRRQTR